MAGAGGGAGQEFPDSDAHVLETLKPGERYRRSGVVEHGGHVWDQIVLYADGAVATGGGDPNGERSPPRRTQVRTGRSGRASGGRSGRGCRAGRRSLRLPGRWSR